MNSSRADASSDFELLCEALLRGDLTTLQRLIAQGADVAARDSYGEDGVVDEALFRLERPDDASTPQPAHCPEFLACLRWIISQGAPLYPSCAADYHPADVGPAGAMISPLFRRDSTLVTLLLMAGYDPNWSTKLCIEGNLPSQASVLGQAITEYEEPLFGIPPAIYTKDMEPTHPYGSLTYLEQLDWMALKHGLRRPHHLFVLYHFGARIRTEYEALLAEHPGWQPPAPQEGLARALAGCIERKDPQGLSALLQAGADLNQIILAPSLTPHPLTPVSLGLWQLLDRDRRLQRASDHETWLREVFALGVQPDAPAICEGGLGLFPPVIAHMHTEMIATLLALGCHPNAPRDPQGFTVLDAIADELASAHEFYFDGPAHIAQHRPSARSASDLSQVFNHWDEHSDAKRLMDILETHGAKTRLGLEKRRHKSNPETLVVRGETSPFNAISKAIAAGQFDHLRELLDAGADLNSRDNCGETAFTEGLESLCERLCQAGEAAPGDDGWFWPLPASNQDLQAVHCCCAWGAQQNHPPIDPSDPDEAQWICGAAMHSPLIYKNTDVLAMLLMCGADPNWALRQPCPWPEEHSFYEGSALLYGTLQYEEDLFGINVPPPESDWREHSAAAEDHFLLWIEYLDRVAVQRGWRRPDHLFLLHAFGARSRAEFTALLEADPTWKAPDAVTALQQAMQACRDRQDAYGLEALERVWALIRSPSLIPPRKGSAAWKRSTLTSTELLARPGWSWPLIHRLLKDHDGTTWLHSTGKAHKFFLLRRVERAEASEAFKAAVERRKRRESPSVARAEQVLNLFIAGEDFAHWLGKTSVAIGPGSTGPVARKRAWPPTWPSRPPERMGIVWVSAVAEDAVRGLVAARPEALPRFVVSGKFYLSERPQRFIGSEFSPWAWTLHCAGKEGPISLLARMDDITFVMPTALEESATPPVLALPLSTRWLLWTAHQLGLPYAVVDEHGTPQPSPVAGLAGTATEAECTAAAQARKSVKPGISSVQVAFEFGGSGLRVNDQRLTLDLVDIPFDLVCRISRWQEWGENMFERPNLDGGSREARNAFRQEAQDITQTLREHFPAFIKISCQTTVKHTNSSTS
jgi:hypothetical protein